MGIRIVPKEELGQERLKEKGIGFIPPVLFPNLKVYINAVLSDSKNLVRENILLQII